MSNTLIYRIIIKIRLGKGQLINSSSKMPIYRSKGTKHNHQKLTYINSMRRK